MNQVTLFRLLFLVAVVASCDSVIAQSIQPRGKAVTDPSLIPLFRQDTIPEYRWRCYCDIDKDGNQDLILSEGLSNASQNGCELFFYIGDSSGKFILYDSTYSAPRKLHFERDGYGIRMWSYWHMSAGSGSLGYSFLTDSGFVGGGGMKVYAHEGEPAISGGIIESYVSYTDVDLKVQTYRIIDGVVVVEREGD